MFFLLSFLVFLNCLQNSLASDEVVLYWGQASAGNQLSLGEYCKETAGDIYVISFINNFNADSLTLNIAGACETTFEGSTLLHCPSIAADIKSCQAAGKKVFVSLGGAAGTYGFSNDNDGKSCAQNVWDLFGGGSADQRPFDDAVVDGFDLDIENGDSKGYAGFANELRSLFASDGSKSYYISAAPQCPYPDASVGDVLSNAHIDYVLIQFYNNYCSLAGNQFNWDTWEDYAKNTSPNKNVKLYVGLPGSTSAAGSGYVEPSQLESKLSGIRSSSYFGGIMVWDASQAFGNTFDGTCFATYLKQLLTGSSSGGSGGSTPSSGAASSAAGSPGSSAAAPSGPASAAPSSAGSPAPGPSTPAAAGSGGASSVRVANFAIDISLSTASPTPASTADLTETSPDVGDASGDSTIFVTNYVSTVIGGQTTTIGATITSAAASSSATSFYGKHAAGEPITTVSNAGCTDGQTQCMNGGYAICDHGAWVVLGCGDGTECEVNDQGNAYCVMAKRQVGLHHTHRKGAAINQIQL